MTPWLSDFPESAIPALLTCLPRGSGGFKVRKDLPEEGTSCANVLGCDRDLMEKGHKQWFTAVFPGPMQTPGSLRGKSIFHLSSVLMESQGENLVPRSLFLARSLLREETNFLSGSPTR